MSKRSRQALALAALVAAVSTAALTTSVVGLAAAQTVPNVRAPFPDRRSPPAWRELDEPASEAFDLGQLVFNSTWVPALTSNAARRDGVGPLFVLGSCDGCHNNGARGRGEADQRLPNSFVLQLGGPQTDYGAVLNTQALPGYGVEGRVSVQWQKREGRYPDGARWEQRDPQYSLSALNYGELPPQVVLRPRIGPALFGSGLLEAVPAEQIETVQRRQPRAVRGQIAWHEVEGRKVPGRFGWMADAVSIEDQTARALAREMGLTSRPLAQDDCTQAQWQCRDAPHGGEPEVSDDFMHAMVTFQRELAVPSRRAVAAAGSTATESSNAVTASATDAAGRGEVLFQRVGCADCHQPQLMASPPGTGTLVIDAYTDLMVHDLGEGLADRTLGGAPVQTLWRTAPLWGISHAITTGEAGLMHDGRARSVEEAVLWHDGQARAARRAFERLPAGDRQALLRWVESL